MNEVVNRFLLAGDKFMPEMRLKQPGFTYSACGPFTKNKERTEKFMETGNTDSIHKNELDRACLQLDMAYSKSKDLAKITQSDKVLRDKAFKIASDPKYDGYLRSLALMVCKFSDKKSSGSGITEPDYQLAEELHKPIVRKFQKRQVYSSFRDNIWGVDLADMQSLSKYIKEIKYLLCAIDLFSKYTWVFSLKYKKETSIVTAFQKIISKGNKIWVDQGSEFHNNSFKEILQMNIIERYSTYNDGKFVVAERFIRNLKSKIFKHMAAISKNVTLMWWMKLLINIITVHRTIKMKPIDVAPNSYAEYNEDSNKKDPKFKVGDHVRISKYKNIFAKGYVPNWSEEVFVVNKIKNTVLWTHVISDLNGEEIAGSFYEKELQKTSQEKFRMEKVIQRKGNILYVKWKGYDNFFNSWIDKKDIV